jgi:hypothetical protein
MIQKLSSLLVSVLVTGAATAQTSDEFEKGFGEATGITESEKKSADDDRLKIGGSLASDLYIEATPARDVLVNLNTLWLYADAKLRNDVRAYVKARGVVEGTSTTSTGAIPASQSDVEEMKLFFNAAKTVFFTVGKQKIKWGSGFFWNPSDVVNQARRDVLYSDDRRSGVTIVKSHVPLGTSNLYLVNSFTDADRVDEIGNALRFEIPVAQSEFAVTASKQRYQEAVFALDASVGVWDFDLHGEAAYSRKSNQLFYGASGPYSKQTDTVNWVVGAAYEFKYSDQDSIAISAEYFRNQDGYKSRADYAYVLASGAYVPYYLADQYALLMVSASDPGSLSGVSFALINLFNVADGSALSKLSSNFTLMQDLNLTVAASYRYGSSDGELRFGNLRYGFETRLKVDF